MYLWQQIKLLKDAVAPGWRQYEGYSEPLRAQGSHGFELNPRPLLEQALPHHTEEMPAGPSTWHDQPIHNTTGPSSQDMVSLDRGLASTPGKRRAETQTIAVSASASVQSVSGQASTGVTSVVNLAPTSGEQEDTFTSPAQMLGASFRLPHLPMLLTKVEHTELVSIRSTHQSPHATPATSPRQVVQGVTSSPRVLRSTPRRDYHEGRAFKRATRGEEAFPVVNQPVSSPNIPSIPLPVSSSSGEEASAKGADRRVVLRVNKPNPPTKSMEWSANPNTYLDQYKDMPHIDTMSEESSYPPLSEVNLMTEEQDEQVRQLFAQVPESSSSPTREGHSQGSPLERGDSEGTSQAEIPKVLEGQVAPPALPVSVEELFAGVARATLNVCRRIRHGRVTKTRVEGPTGLTTLMRTGK